MRLLCSLLPVLQVCYWLLQNGIKVMIAACDTFRSGAVEQLKTHCARLQVGAVYVEWWLVHDHPPRSPAGIVRAFQCEGSCAWPIPQHPAAVLQSAVHAPVYSSHNFLPGHVRHAISSTSAGAAV